MDVFPGLREVQLAAKSGDPTLSTPAVPYLLGAVNATKSIEDKAQLLALLALEYRRLKSFEKELEALQAAIELTPDDPMLRIHFSELYLYREQYEQARQMGEIAVSTAEAAGMFRRHALQTLARALAGIPLFAELQTVVEKLISMKVSGPDVAIEADFLVELPPGSISDEIRQQYLSLRDIRVRE